MNHANDAADCAASAHIGGSKKMSLDLDIKYDPEEDLSAPPMKISDKELAMNQIPLKSRDHCAHLLVELNRCQRKHYYLPWTCEKEKHNYEGCVAVERKKILLGQQQRRQEEEAVSMKEKEK